MEKKVIDTLDLSSDIIKRLEEKEEELKEVDDTDIEKTLNKLCEKNVLLKNDADQKKFIDSIRTLNGNLNVTLILYKYDDQVYAK